MFLICLAALRAVLAAPAPVEPNAVTGPAIERSPATLTMRDAVSLAIERNRTLVAAKLDVQLKLVDEIAARLWHNPSFAYQVQNLVLGSGNNEGLNIKPSFGNERQESIGLTQTFDIWGKRQKRLAVAKQASLGARLAVEDVLRELAYSVRARFADVVREQAQSELVRETQLGYGQTVDLMRRREAAGDIARSDLDKVELEAMRYLQDALQASLELGQARAALAQLLALGDANSLPPQLEAPSFSVSDELVACTDMLVQRALLARPDMRQAEALRVSGALAVEEASREAFPDLQLGLAYNNSHFTVAGDNPHALQVNVGFEIPVFDRNQAGRSRAVAQKASADNALLALRMQVEHEVRDSTLQWQRSGESLRLYEQGGMIERAERAKNVAKRSFAAGATSLLELLEAERTRLATQAEYLKTLDAWRQAHIAVAYATHHTGGL